MVVINPGHWRTKTTTTAMKRGVAYAGFDGLVIRKSSGRWRNATPNQLNKAHRSYREGVGHPAPVPPACLTSRARF